MPWSASSATGPPATTVAWPGIPSSRQPELLTPAREVFNRLERLVLEKMYEVQAARASFAMLNSLRAGCWSSAGLCHSGSRPRRRCARRGGRLRPGRAELKCGPNLVGSALTFGTRGEGAEDGVYLSWSSSDSRALLCSRAASLLCRRRVLCAFKELDRVCPESRKSSQI
jgi:hypothetical protein